MVIFKDIVEKCLGCNKIVDNKCSAYVNPNFHWDGGRKCLLTSNVTILSDEEKRKRRIGQQKQKVVIGKGDLDMSWIIRRKREK